MFRSRTHSSSKAESVPTSSLSSGNASIQRPTTPIYNEPISYNEEDNYHQNEMIDLQAPPTKNDLTIDAMSAVIAAAVQMSSVGGSLSSLSLGSASILQPFSKTEAANEKRRFSTRLFSWNKKNPANSLTSSPTSSAPTTPGLEPSSPFDSTSSIGTMDDDNSSQGSPRTSSASATAGTTDDGRDELLYRGIQIKEIKTTLKTLVISDEARCPMPEIRIERPGFARINY
ncbi:hypothetical protein BD770DRAFT_392477 [Pilaira anomala]|nr:hypothetical protein BD770DRAFT_392477 [Pilaira anomala]